MRSAMEDLGLTSLDVANTPIGDATLKRLAQLRGLRRLYLNDTNVTADAVAAFRADHPAAFVSWGARPAPRIPLSPGPKHER